MVSEHAEIYESVTVARLLFSTAAPMAFRWKKAQYQQGHVHFSGGRVTLLVPDQLIAA
jgi:hypothetical protein